MPAKSYPQFYCDRGKRAILDKNRSMLQHKVSINTKHTWQRAMAEAIRDPFELLKTLGLPADLIDGHEGAAQQFPLRVPRSYVARMEYGNPNDPLLRQVLPLAEETQFNPHFTTDPVADQAAVKQQGLLQKYQGRVLLMTTPVCAIHCRYCFRRHFPYAEHSSRQADEAKIMEQIASDSSIHEVILSGGDPLSLSDEHLGRLIKQLSQIPHLKRLRIHSRQPIVLPERINDELLNQLSDTRLNTVCVIHCNHANEIDKQVAQVLSNLRQTGTTLLNQAVLLKGINDSSDNLCALSEKLFDNQVLPYYLHMLDKVEGAAHFDISEQQALILMDEMRTRLPGYLVPQLVREISHEPYKTPLTQSITI